MTEKWAVSDINKFKLTSMEQGRAMLADVNRQMADKLAEMQEAETNAEHQMLSDERYELLKMRRRIQSEMGRLFKENYIKPAKAQIAQELGRDDRNASRS